MRNRIKAQPSSTTQDGWELINAEPWRALPQTKALLGRLVFIAEHER